MKLEELDEEELDDESIKDDSDEIEILYSLQASVIDIRPRDIPVDARDVPAYAPNWDQYDPTLPCQTRIGDPWAKVAEEAQPLPGDSTWITQDPLQHRFHIVKEHAPFYAIYDRHQLRRAEIHEEYLKDFYFRIGYWYANQLCLKFKIPDVGDCRDWSMSDVLGHNASRVLRSGITTLYPS